MTPAGPPPTTTQFVVVTSTGVSSPASVISLSSAEMPEKNDDHHGGQPGGDEGPDQTGCRRDIEHPGDQTDDPKDDQQRHNDVPESAFALFFF
jgi:hypothetical protein